MTPQDDILVRLRPRFPKRYQSALIWLASPIANVIKAGGHGSAIKGRTYGRNAPVWGQTEGSPLTAGSFHIWDSTSGLIVIQALDGTIRAD
jgi:hypothetical protein